MANIKGKFGFLREARDKYVNRFSYLNLDEYKNGNSILQVKCNICGSEYTQKGKDHMVSTVGCMKCKISGRGKTTHEFIYDGRQTHGNTYDYSKTKYIDAKTKVNITCRIHGEYFQNPSSHLKGIICPQCTRDKTKKTLEYYLNLAKERHNDKFDYSLIKKEDFKGADDRCPIRCKACGYVFTIKFYYHLSGRSGCRECHNKSKSSNLANMIVKCKEKYGEKYDYSLIEKDKYSSSSQYIDVKCNDCNKIFTTRFAHHLKYGVECQHCSRKTRKDFSDNRYDLEVLLEKANKLWNHEFDYSNINAENFRNVGDSHVITHKICGNSFSTTMSSHITRGIYCPFCRPHGYSKISLKCFEIISKVWGVNVEHAENCGEMKVYFREFGVDSKFYKNYLRLDGFIPETEIYLDFHGSIFHGDIRDKAVKSLDDVNPFSRQTYRELYEKTLDRRRIMEEIGLSYIEIWEYDFKKAIENGDDPNTNPELVNFVNNLKVYGFSLA